MPLMPKKHSFGLLTQEQIEAAWPQIHSLLSRADPYSQGEFIADDMLDLSREGKAHVFALLTEHGMETALAVTFTTYPRIKVMNVAMIGGKHAKLALAHYAPILEQFARDCGASRITAWCRPSAARLFNSITGTRMIYQVIAKGLT